MADREALAHPVCVVWSGLVLGLFRGGIWTRARARLGYASLVPGRARGKKVGVLLCIAAVNKKGVLCRY